MVASIIALRHVSDLIWIFDLDGCVRVASPDYAKKNGSIHAQERVSGDRGGILVALVHFSRSTKGPIFPSRE